MGRPMEPDKENDMHRGRLGLFTVCSLIAYQEQVNSLRWPILAR